jgi:hypothetical protein
VAANKPTSWQLVAAKPEAKTMRRVLLAVLTALVLGLSVYLSAGAQNEGVKVKLRLVDADTGKGVGGIVRVFRAGSDKPLALPGLFDRLRGLEPKDNFAGWYVVPAAGAETTLPRTGLRLEAVSGLETALTVDKLDLSGKVPDEVMLKLKFLFRPEKSDLAAGNTHLHLRGLTKEDADEYLRQIPAADGLRVMFISYLERHKDDAAYITNRYPIGELIQFEATGVLFNNGEEHRHNFEAYGQGYGHVMFLDLKQLVQPVSLGPGITGAGTDDVPLRPGIEDARKQGGTVIWCHNTNGYEDVPSALAGQLDALNVFDGSRTGTFEENYYRYLNVGMRMPISTGTDWFVYDFARVYAKVHGKLTVPSWLQALKAGRCQATNGPLLTLTVAGKEVGETIQLEQPKTVRVEVTGLGRHDFQRLQLLHNGQVLQAQAAEKKDGAYSARLVREVKIDGPGWFAARIDSATKNEFGHVLYAHTSPVSVEFAGKRVFDVEAARGLLKLVEEGQAEIRKRGRFSSDQARDKLLALYEQAAQDLVGRINQRGR